MFISIGALGTICATVRSSVQIWMKTPITRKHAHTDKRQEVCFKGNEAE